MTEDQMNRALDAIHDEAARLLNFEGPEKEREMSDGLQLIMSLARYKFDVRSTEEIKRAHSDQDI